MTSLKPEVFNELVVIFEVHFVILTQNPRNSYSVTSKNVKLLESTST